MHTANARDAAAKLNTRFCGDIRNLLRRHGVPCAGEKDQHGLGEALFTNAAFRSDLFALCNSISHMSEHDLSVDELLDLVIASYGPGLTASEETRVAFSSAYQGWHARELAIELPQRGLAHDSEAPAVAMPKVPMSEMDETLQRISESSLELKLFLADVKQRVTEIDPELQHLEQMIAQMKGGTPLAAEPRAAAVMPVQVVRSDGARVRRLWVAVGVLSAALGLTLGGAAWLARGYAGGGTGAPVTIVDGTVTQPLPVPVSKKAPAASGAGVAVRREQGGRVLAARRGLPASTVRGTETARVPAPIIRRDPDAHGTQAEASREPVFVPASTMIGYALASPKPVYPAVSVPDDKASRVEVQATISPTGEVVATHVLSGPILFRDAAERALQGWRFRPYLVDGSAVKVNTTVAFVFRSMPAT